MTEQLEEIMQRRAERGPIDSYVPPAAPEPKAHMPPSPVLSVRHGNKLLAQMNEQGQAQLEPGVTSEQFVAALYATIRAMSLKSEAAPEPVPTGNYYLDLAQLVMRNPEDLVKALMERDFAILALKEISKGKGGVAISKRMLSRMERKVEDIPAMRKQANDR